MRMSMCCCGAIECMGCRVPRRYDVNNPEINFGSSFVWPYTSSSCTNGGYNIIQYAANAADIVSGISLRKRPDGGTGYGQLAGANMCQWLWNKPVAVQTLYHLNTIEPPSTIHYGTLSELAQYEPVNSTDATSPWNRELTTITNATCTTCVWSGCSSANDRWKCITGLYWGSVTLWVEEVASVPTWRMYVLVFLERSISGTTTHGAEPIGSQYPGAGGGACGGYSGEHIRAAARATYEAPVDCANDFKGDPIILPFITQVGAPTPFTAYPSEIEVLFPLLP